LIGKGMSTDEIASNLGVTLFTIRKHRNNISAKLDIHTTSKLVSFAIHYANTAGSLQATIPRPDNLSDREKEILRKLEIGLTAKEIARDLHISSRTVSKHVENIRFKTGLRALADLMMVSRQLQSSAIQNAEGATNTHSE